MDICKNCGGKLIVKSTASNAAAAKRLNKQYYYTAYYYCPHCKKLYHDDKFKKINTSLPSSFLDDSKKQNEYDVEIWTDGACIHNGTPKARAAWAFVAHSAIRKASKEDTGHAGIIEGKGLVEGKQTNNVAEGLAIYHALVWAANREYKKIKLHTDSQISLFNLKKHHSLVKVNREIFAKIAEVMEKNELKVNFIKVLGHSGDPNNDRVDKIANDMARSKS